MEVRDVDDPNEIKKFMMIQERVWGSEITPHHIIVAIKEVGGVVKGAYIGDNLVGFVYGFIGRYMGRYCIYSHQLAVLPEYQNLGIGRILKEEQRKWAIENGYDLIIWTFDPARSKNAWLNINKLGTIAKVYLPNHYGEMDDDLNRGVPSDRFMTEWHIKSRWIRNRPRYRDISEIKDVEYILKVYRKNDTVYPSINSAAEGRYMAVEIPPDFDSLGKNTREAKIQWKLSLRKALTDLFRKGYTAIHFVKSGENYAYILKKRFDPNDSGTW